MTGRDTAQFTAALVLGALVGAAVTMLVRTRRKEPAAVLDSLRRLGGGG